MVDLAWQSFEQFAADMGPRPSRQHTLDRRDNNGPYSKDNCRWATRVQQQNNTRKTVIIEHDGRAKPLTVWADELGISRATLATRIKRGDLPPEELLQPRLRTARGSRVASAVLKDEDIPRVRQLYADGETLESIANRFGTHETTIGHVVHRRTWRHIA